MKTVFREILVFVAGATPQIITETIYALSRKSPPVYADDILVITTSTGRKLISEALITRGILRQLIDEYELPPLQLNEESIIVLKDADGAELDDIRSLEANEAAGDQIVEFLRSLTDNPANRLHCSLAGGRKTMSFYIGMALQLFGRKLDRLYHVLVTPTFETHPQFFYKPKYPVIIDSIAPNGSRRQLNTADAEIELAELPFIRFSDKFSFQGHGFKSLVQQGQTDIDTAPILPDLIFDYKNRSIQLGKETIELVPVQLMLYCTFLKQKTDHCKYPAKDYCTDCTGCYQSVGELASIPALEAMAKEYARIHASKDKAFELLEKWTDGLGVELIRQNISKINRSIRESLHDEAQSLFYQVKTSGRRWGNSCYGVRLDKGKIKFR